jgi:imidazolonepropionase-like amidohydrolase
MTRERALARAICVRVAVLVLGFLVLWKPSDVSSQEEATAATIIVGVNVVDLDGGPPLRGAVVRIEGDRFVSIGEVGAEGVGSVAGEDRVQVIDARGMWMVPGLMNMHVHLGLVLPGAEGAALANETEAELALRMAAAARGALLAGVTTIRTTGEERYVDIARARAIDRGAAEGPRIFSAGEAVQVTGGHGSSVGVRANDGPYEFREASRLQIRPGPAGSRSPSQAESPRKVVTSPPPS